VIREGREMVFRPSFLVSAAAIYVVIRLKSLPEKLIIMIWKNVLGKGGPYEQIRR
jgi:hypothetical protein